MEERAVSVGARVESEGYFGTVKFVGEVTGTKGDWLGVEWDDSSRGKHDGSKDGVRYFQTKEPTSGSFVRPKKVNPGVSFLQALRERYGRVDGDNAGVIEEELYVVGKGKQTTVEMVGAKSVNLQQSAFDKLLEVVLRAEYVSDSGPEGLIGRTIPNVTDLDVSKCLLGSWRSVADITSQLKHMKTLNVSDNRLEVPDNPEVLKAAFLQLKTLFLNRCAYDWEQLMRLAMMWPQLQTMHTCFNHVTTISDVTQRLDALRLLNLEGNPLAGWEQVLKLSELKSLEILILNGCGIDEIHFRDVQYGSTTKYFQNLKSLSIFHNKIAEWGSINELMKLHGLEDIKLRFNPLTSQYENEEDLRYLVVAKIPKLKVYNRTKVDSETRKGAEVDYLKIFGKEWKECGGNQDPSKNHPSPEFTLKHPRYQQLLDKYGAPEDSELIMYSSALKNTLLEVTIDSPNVPLKAPLHKKLPGSMTVQKLKAMLQRVYRADPETLILTYTNWQMPDKEIEFDNNMREISFYALETGDVIHVKW